MRNANISRREEEGVGQTRGRSLYDLQKYEFKFCKDLWVKEKMAVVMPPENADPVLLFCDTFSHPENEVSWR